MDMGERIHALRKAKGLTLEEVGNAVGVGKSTVRKWESGQIANMRRDKIASLARVLGVKPSELMGWDEHKEVAPPPPSAEQIQAEMERAEFSRLYATLSPENRQRILDLMQALSSKK